MTFEEHQRIRRRLARNKARHEQERKDRKSRSDNAKVKIAFRKINDKIRRNAEGQKDRQRRLDQEASVS